MITIKRINIDDGYLIQYDQKNDNGTGYQEHTIRCWEKANPEFEESIARLVEYFAEICELPESYKARIYVYQIDFKYKDGGESVVIKGRMRLHNYPGEKLELKTPVKEVSPFDKDMEGSEYSRYMSKAMENILEMVKNEAIFYIKGERAQMSLLGTA